MMNTWNKENLNMSNFIVLHTTRKEQLVIWYTERWCGLRSDEWDKKDGRLVNGMLKEFGKYNIKETCPFCSFKKRMTEKFGHKLILEIFSKREHEAKLCFVDDFVFHTMINPPKKEELQNKSSEYWNELASNRFDKLLDMVKNSKK